ncbi:MAG TPA: LysE family transporter [Candidatus Angelobacter sp.]|nr:LysE family transporter [Candidatus Angelobacter sp.]
MPPIVISWLTGFISGLLLAIPVGPVNLTIMNEGAQLGFRQAAMISTGALLMETLYCGVAFTSFASVFNHAFIKEAMDLGSFVFMLGLGLWFLKAKAVRNPTKIEERLEQKFRPTSAFMTGFVRVMGNLGVPASWLFFAVYFDSHHWVDPAPASKAACVFGVTTATGLWFFGLSYAAALGHKKFSDRTLLRMERGSGIGLLVLALAHGCQIVWQMHHSHHL